MRLVAFSDTHGEHKKLKVPEGDVLIFAGDYSGLGNLGELLRFNAWLATLPHQRKFLVPGNHDRPFQAKPEEADRLLTAATLVIDREVTFSVGGEGYRLYGSPWTPTFMNWAFMEAERELSERFHRIPRGLDILVTHGPPEGVLDRGLGSRTLAAVLGNRLVRLHLFGHIHETPGLYLCGSRLSANVALCDDLNRLIHEPLVIDL
jgi:Icc-related predicted phosphoesterase